MSKIKKNKKKKLLKKVIKNKRKTKRKKKKLNKSKKETFLRTPKGTFDILPNEQKYYERIEGVVKHFAKLFGFQKIETPIIEFVDLFKAGLGAGTDVVEKEMYSFKTKGGDYVVLRPEGTAPVARAYLSHGMFNLLNPQRLYYTGPMFRYENPQSGRFREHHQFGFELIGDKDPIYDAQIMNLFKNILEALGFDDIVFQVNSIGCKMCRKRYIKKLLRFYKKHLEEVCRYCKVRYEKNPLRLLDCKEDKCQPVKEEAPLIVDYLCDECKEHFKKVLGYLDELNIPYLLSSHLVRGLDYYTNTVFEIVREEKTEQDSDNLQRIKTKDQLVLGGGGRYNDLIKMLGKKDIPGVGGACGFERIILEMKSENIKLPKSKQAKVFLVQLGDVAKKQALKLYNELQKSGILVREAFSRTSIKSQLAIADKMKILYALILGQKEALEGTVIIRDMTSGVQETVSVEKVISKLKQKLKSS